jgi:hypothetical protein
MSYRFGIDTDAALARQELVPLLPMSWLLQYRYRSDQSETYSGRSMAECQEYMRLLHWDPFYNPVESILIALSLQAESRPFVCGSHQGRHSTCVGAAEWF